MMRRFLIQLLFVMASGLSLAQPLPVARKRAVYGNGYYIAPSQYDYSQVAKDIVKGKKSRYEQARALYLWICEHISYDTQTDIRTADLCWDRKRAVCQGYCELYYRMADCINLNTTLVYGHCRLADGSSEEHSWLSVNTEKGDILMDPTWGAGAVVNGQFQRQMMPLLWFDIDPEWLIFTHYPQNKKHQHLTQKVTEEVYDKLQYTTPLTAKLCIKPSQLLYDMEQGKSSIPLIPTLSAAFMEHITLQQVPMIRQLNVGEPVTLIVKKHSDCELTLKNGKQTWTEKAWKKEGNVYSITITPANKGELQLTVGTKGFVHLSAPVLEYRIESK